MDFTFTLFAGAYLQSVRQVNAVAGAASRRLNRPYNSTQFAVARIFAAGNNFYDQRSIPGVGAMDGGPRGGSLRSSQPNVAPAGDQELFCFRQLGRRRQGLVLADGFAVADLRRKGLGDVLEHVRDRSDQPGAL
jgi:hypothetical protein